MARDAGAAPPRDTSTLIATDFRVPSTEPGVEIHVRNKRPHGTERFDESRVVVYIHGATFPGTIAFDHRLFGGGSWMDYMALHGFDCYLFDVRGYGRSTRPPAMLESPHGKPPYARTPEAIADLSAVVEFVRQRTGVARVNLIGWSWGTAIGGGYTATHTDTVRNLAMFAPLWIIRSTPATVTRWMLSASPWAVAGANGFMSAYRTVTRREMRERWVRGLDAHTAEQVMPAAEYDGWWDALAALDPEAGHEKGVRAPNGVMADLVERWCANRPTYAPEDIRVPTLLLLGEWDIDTPPYMAQELFGRLTAAPYKRLEMLARGTHSMALEINRVDLYRRVREFIETRYL